MSGLSPQSGAKQTSRCHESRFYEYTPLVHAALWCRQEGGHGQWLVVLLAREFEILRSFLQRLHVGHERRYVTIHELNMLIGDGKLYRLFSRWSSSEAKLTDVNAFACSRGSTA
jgi:hypothetical protein